MSEDFLSRWSRRKRAAQRTDAQPEPAEAPPESAGAPESVLGPDTAADPSTAGLPEGEPDEEEIARLPSLDDLTADSDISMFMRKGVPERLRNAALRRMWSLDPKIRDYVSEAREYAYDWNTPGGVPGFGGPLPPPEEIQKMAARIIGVFTPETEPPVEAAGPGSSETCPSQNGESSGSATVQETKAAAPAEAGARVAADAAAIPKPLGGLSSEELQRVDRATDRAQDYAGSRQEQREQPQKPPRPPRHGGAMPV
jgi:hypothetical protein